MYLLIVNQTYLFMFQLNAKTDYGLLIMLELAKSNTITPLSPLAKRLKVSSPYLSQIANSLFKAGLVKSKEGATGGYYLAKSAEEISVWSILAALSGEVKVRCTDTGHKTCPNFRACGLKSAWPLLLEDIKASLAHRSLADLLDKKI